MNRFDSLLDRPPRELRLSAAQIGNDGAPPVLVLHGMAGSRRSWVPRIRPLAGRYRLLIPDLPGFGHSPKPFVDYTMDFFIEVLSGYLDRTVDGQPLRRVPWRVVADSRKFLLIQGGRDIIAPLDPLRELCDRPPHPTLNVVEHAGHNLYLTHTSECMALIERFLDDTTTRSVHE